MDIDTKNIIIERFNTVPVGVQEFLLGEPLQTYKNGIRETYDLSEDLSTQLENEIALVALFFQGIDALEENLINELGLDPQDASDIYASAIDILPPEVFGGGETTPSAAETESAPNDHTPEAALTPFEKLQMNNLNNELNTAQQSESVVEHAVPVSSYKKPLIDTPSYDEQPQKPDPYHEPIE